MCWLTNNRFKLLQVGLAFLCAEGAAFSEAQLFIKSAAVNAVLDEMLLRLKASPIPVDEATEEFGKKCALLYRELSVGRERWVDPFDRPNF